MKAQSLSDRGAVDSARGLQAGGIHFGPRRFLREDEERIRSRSYRELEVRPLAPTVGAEIGGVDLADLDEASFREIQRAFLDYKVLFFRNQPLTTAEHTAFARRFGDLEEHPFLPAKDGHGDVIRFAKDEETVGVENNWHSDVSWRERPSLGSVLRSVEVPEVGGDTLFADMTAAYDGLSDELKTFLADKVAVHDFTQAFGWQLDPEARAARQKEFPPVEHPIVRTHPETGRKILYVNVIFTSHIVGLPAEESAALLASLYREAHVPEYQCRFHWEKDSVALWDNRAVQHYAASDYWPKARVMERVTIIGDRPA